MCCIKHGSGLKVIGCILLVLCLSSAPIFSAAEEPSVDLSIYSTEELWMMLLSGLERQESELTTLQTQLENSQEPLQKAGQLSQKLQLQVSGLQTDITGLQTSFRNLQGDMESIQTEVIQLRSSNTWLKIGIGVSVAAVIVMAVSNL